jgi:hydrogenase nickel incorporation protein HypB
MCDVCGCDSHDGATATNLQTGKVIVLDNGAHAHEHVGPDGIRYTHVHGTHSDGRTHGHVHADGTRHVHSHPVGAYSHVHEPHGAIVSLETRILAKNDALAVRNRQWLAQQGVLAVNLMSAPGAGKTTLLERTIRELNQTVTLCVVEGDQATANDGERIRAAGAPVVQVNTGTGCHLDADMVARGLAELAPPRNSIVVIENVGNLVCPALFDLGERRRVVIFSVTEGEDKPLKYPHMFRAADLVLLSKIDLLPHVDFDETAAIAHVRAVKPGVEVVRVSARTGEGFAAWYGWLSREASSQHAHEQNETPPE